MLTQTWWRAGNTEKNWVIYCTTSATGSFHKWFFHCNLNLMETLFSSHPSCGEVITMKICAWHYSYRGMCKSCSITIPYNWSTLKSIFHQWKNHLWNGPLVYSLTLVHKPIQYTEARTKYPPFVNGIFRNIFLTVNCWILIWISINLIVCGPSSVPESHIPTLCENADSISGKQISNYDYFRFQSHFSR